VSSRFLTALPRLLACVEQLGRKPLDHGLVVAVARRGDHPADRERLAALGADFDRHLVGGTTDAARAHFDRPASTLSSACLNTGSGFAWRGSRSCRGRRRRSLSATDFLPSYMIAVHELRRRTEIAELGSGDFTLFAA